MEDSILQCLVKQTKRNRQNNMMMKRSTSFIFLSLIPLWLSAQIQLDRQLISSAGSFTLTGNMSLSSSVGETVTVTGTSSSIVLTQGFQQPDEPIAVSILEREAEAHINVYPNPVIDELTIELKEFKGSASMRLSQSSGKLIWERTMGDRPRETVSFRGLATGMYVLMCLKENKVIGSWRIVKTE